MISKLKAVLDDDRGVSPVIGVILMVAITVILAAVIGTFVLGLGDSLEQAPQSQLDAEAVDPGSGYQLDISHNGGDTISQSELRIVIDGDEGTYSADSVGSNDFTVGDTLTIVPGDVTDDAGSNPSDFDGFGETDVQLIHSPSDSIILDTTVEFP